MVAWNCSHFLVIIILFRGCRRSMDTEDLIRIRHVTPGLVNNAVSSNLQSPAHPNRLVPPSDRGGIASIPDGDTPVPRSRAGCCAI